MLTEADVQRVRMMGDAIAEVARILADERYPDRLKVFAAQERLRQLTKSLGSLRDGER